jgi:hypothetical protein
MQDSRNLLLEELLNVMDPSVQDCLSLCHMGGKSPEQFQNNLEAKNVQRKPFLPVIPGQREV